MNLWATRGVIEGFYGPPWSWDARERVMAFCHDRGMTDYIYAPKDDPLHRARWRELYPRDMLAGFERIVGLGTLRVGFAISPGLSIDYHGDADWQALAAKVDQLVDVGIDLVCLALDDIDVRPGLGDDQVALTNRLHEHIGDRASLVLVPTEYTGTRSTAYLDALAAGLPADVPIGWTGPSVVNDTITRDAAEARAESLGGRLPFLWDNYPVNDGFMADRLFMGPLRGRDPDLGAACSGYAANPMVQPLSSLPALGSIAAYLAGDDPGAGWAAAVDELGIRIVAEACDGARPNELVRRVVASAGEPGWVEPLRDLDTWLRQAALFSSTDISDADLGAEVEPWVRQMNREAEVGRAAARVLQAIRPIVDVDASGAGRVARATNKVAVEHAMALAVLWPVARHGSVSVMGPRCSFRPVLGQWPDGEWRFLLDSLIEDGNAIDVLVRHALAELDDFDNETSLTVAVDHHHVDLQPEARFHAPPGSVVTATSGPVITTVVAPTTPALKDNRLPAGD